MQHQQLRKIEKNFPFDSRRGFRWGRRFPRLATFSTQSWKAGVDRNSTMFTKGILLLAHTDTIAITKQTGCYCLATKKGHATYRHCKPVCLPVSAVDHSCQQMLLMREFFSFKLLEHKYSFRQTKLKSNPECNKLHKKNGWIVFRLFEEL